MGEVLTRAPGHPLLVGSIVRADHLGDYSESCNKLTCPVDWVSEYGPPRIQKLLSYLVGWYISILWRRMVLR